MTDFVSFARAHGLILDYIEPDNRWRRYKTVDKPRRKNGCAIFDGRSGAVCNYATMTDFATWRDGSFEKVPMRDYREARRKAAAEEAKKHAKAAAEAARIVKAATLLTPAPAVPWKPWRAGKEAVLAHPYLIRKGLPNASCLVHEGNVIVPMRIDREHRRELVNVQRITPEGEKRFLTGGRAKGAVYRIGPERVNETWLVEGYATGLSLLQALKGMYRVAAVVVCFSAGNLKYPGATHVMADNDASEAGQKAAEATGLPWVMPPEVGMDANDLHAREGIGALQKLIRGIRT
jgi:putative DNA primase/helicase